MTAFTLEAIGGLWAKRLEKRRAGLEVDWNDIAREATPDLVAAARDVWTRSAFSEYASGAAFAQIATHLLAARAPIDLIAAAGEFVADEMFHAELASRLAMSLGGAVRLAGATIRSFAVLFGRECNGNEGLGALPCARFDGTFLDAVTHDVVEPLAERGIVVPPEDVADLRDAVSA